MLSGRNKKERQQNTESEKAFVKMLYKLFHSVLDQIIGRWITAHYTSPLLFPFMHFAIL